MPKGRRVRRVIRKIDTWTVLKVAALFHLCMFGVVTIAGVLLWHEAVARGQVAKLEKSVKSQLSLKSFVVEGPVLFRSWVIIGLVGVAVATVLTVLAAVIYNLLTDLVGGVQLWVLEEELRPAAQAAEGREPVAAVPPPPPPPPVRAPFPEPAYGRAPGPVAADVASNGGGLRAPVGAPVESVDGPRPAPAYPPEPAPAPHPEGAAWALPDALRTDWAPPVDAPRDTPSGTAAWAAADGQEPQVSSRPVV